MSIKSIWQSTQYWKKGLLVGISISLIIFIGPLLLIISQYNGDCGLLILQGPDPCSLWEYMDIYTRLWLGILPILPLKLWLVIPIIILVSTFIGLIIGEIKSNKK